jgi:uncharacterized protein YdaU (DUF1376 family)
MAAADLWMPLWVADYQADTKRLTLLQHGAYLLLLMDYWRNGAPPDDDDTLARILGVSRRDWLKIRPQIAPFFRVENGRWTHKRVEREKAGAVEKSGKAAAKAKAAAERRWRGGRGPGRDAPGNAPSNAPSTGRPMPQAMPEDMLEQCPSPVTYSVPTEQAAGAVDPNKEAWRRGVALLVASGRMHEAKARSLFGKLLRDNKLEGRDLLPSVISAEVKGTQDPQGYLTAAARQVGQRGPGAKASDVLAWGEEQWRMACSLWREDRTWGTSMGPTPDQPGCMAPAHVLREFNLGAAA